MKDASIMKHRTLRICAALVLVTAGVYSRVYKNEFINYDDPQYVTANKQVQGGVSLEGIKWAFMTNFGSNWHPVTWISHMLDCQLFGLNAGAHHLMNVLFHLANTVLLFVVFQRMTGAVWRSGFAAGLFALHPLNVESVAWVAERKNVLSTLFWLLTMLAYVRYAERPKTARYLFVLIFFVFGLLSKPMIVTLPIVLLILDWWPLRRFGVNSFKSKFDKRSFLRLVIEKLPLFVLAAGLTIVTLLAEQKMIVSLKGLSIAERAGNALVSYGVYLWKMIWPMRLAVFYPYHRTFSLHNEIVSALVLALLIIPAIRSRHRHLLAGLLWYIVTLVPVAGFVQVGLQRYADRYTYVPLMGIFAALVWWASDFLEQQRYGKVFLRVSAAVVVFVLAALTWMQAGYWRDDISLYEHALSVTEGNYLAHNNLGTALKGKGRGKEAIRHWQAAMIIYPGYSDAIANYGSELVDSGRIDEAIKIYTTASERGAGGCQFFNNFANAFKAKGNSEEAIKYYRKALEFDADAWQVHYNLGVTLGQSGNYEEAAKHLKKMISIYPGLSSAYTNLGQALSLQGKFNEAIDYYKEALRLNPQDKVAEEGLKIAEARKEVVIGTIRFN